MHPFSTPWKHQGVEKGHIGTEWFKNTYYLETCQKKNVCGRIGYSFPYYFLQLVHLFYRNKGYIFFILHLLIPLDHN